MSKGVAYYKGHYTGAKYGIWNSCAKQFQFGICEDSPMLAVARLWFIIGEDARKWRFTAKLLPKK